MPGTQRHDFWSGLVFSVLGLAFAWGAGAHPVGTIAHMQAGYFPMTLGVALAAVGLLMTVRAVWRDRRVQSRAHGSAGQPAAHGNLSWRPVVFVLGANLAFGGLLVGIPELGVPAFGMVVAVPALVATSSLAQTEVRWREVAWLSAILTAGSYVVFVHLLHLQIPVWPDFLLGWF